MANLDQIKSQLMNASKGKHLDVVGDITDHEWLESEVHDLNRILSGSLFTSIPTRSHTGLVGPETSGKSSFMALMLADAQRKGYLPVVIDTEGAWTPQFVERWGIDPNNILRVPSMWVDEIELYLTNWIDKGINNLAIALDSLGAVELKKVIRDGVDKKDVKSDQGGLYRDIKRMLKMIVQITKFQDSVSFTSGHLFGNPTGYGSPEQIGGGKYFRLSCDILISLKQTPLYENPSAKTKDEKGKVLGNKITAATLKNRYYPPFNEGTVEIDFKKGINKMAGMIELAKNMGLIEQNGAWYKCESLGIKEQGKDNFLKKLKEVDTKPLFNDIETMLQETGYSTINESLQAEGVGYEAPSEEIIEEDEENTEIQEEDYTSDE